MFLATTALSEFWGNPESQETLFLGTWCLPYHSRHLVKDFSYSILPCPWDDRSRYKEALQNVGRAHEKILKELTGYLNAVHNTSYDLRSWRILIGYWLQIYLEALYDRLTLLQDSLDLFPDLKTVVLSETSYKTATDTLDFMELLYNDPYNLQLFSQTLNFLGLNFPDREVSGPWRISESSPPKSRPISPIKSILRNLRVRANEALLPILETRARIGLCDLGVSDGVAWRLSAKTRGLAVPVPASNWRLTASEPVFDGRRRSLASITASTQFERLAINSLAQNFPTIYLEGFEKAKYEVEKRSRYKLPVLVSSVGWFYNERFKILSAGRSERGKLIASQVGGGYGMWNYPYVENHITSITDKFLVWGWANQGDQKLTNAPGLKPSILIGKEEKVKRKNKNILFVNTDHPRFVYRLHASPIGSQLESYFQSQIAFIGFLSKDLQSQLIVRLYPGDFGMNVRHLIKETFPWVKFDSSGDYHDAIRDAKVVVIDHASTTFLEALSLNVPTILFWDPKLWEMRDEASPYFNKLIEAGILHSGPLEAGRRLKEISSNPELWWQSEKVQSTRREFLNKFALSDRDWLEVWSKILKGLLKGA